MESRTSHPAFSYIKTTFNLILSNERISKEELAIRINKSEKTVQRIISKLIDYKLIIRRRLLITQKV